MRRLLASAATVCLIAFAAGCGGDDGASGPLESALSYVPKNSPFVVAIHTDLEGGQYRSLQDLLDRFPGGVKIDDLLGGQLSQDNVSFDKDVKPLLGNPFVVSATDVSSFLAEDNEDFVGVLEVADPEALDRIIDKTKPREQGEVGGATVYDDDGTFFAVKEDTIVFGPSERQLETTLERADADEGMSPDRFAEGLEGLPEEALARVFLDVEGLLSGDADAESARKIEWVKALRTMGLTVAAEDDSLRTEFNVITEGELSEQDLPLAAGEEAPAVIREDGEIGFGVRDASQIVTFFEAAFQAVEPEQFGDYETAKGVISQRLGVDVDDDVFAQLTEDMSVTVALDGSFGARAEVKSPDAFSDTVDKVADALPELGAGLGVVDVRRSGDLYEAQLDDGGRLFFGVTGDVFVAASDAARAQALAAEDPVAVEGAEGSLVMAADAEQVALEVIDLLGPQLGLGGLLGGGLFARPLDEVTGSVTTSTEGMRGRFSLTFD